MTHPGSQRHQPAVEAPSPVHSQRAPRTGRAVCPGRRDHRRAHVEPQPLAAHLGDRLLGRPQQVGEPRARPVGRGASSPCSAGASHSRTNAPLRGSTSSRSQPTAAGASATAASARPAAVADRDRHRRAPAVEPGLGRAVGRGEDLDTRRRPRPATRPTAALAVQRPSAPVRAPAVHDAVRPARGARRTPSQPSPAGRQPTTG